MVIPRNRSAIDTSGGGAGAGAGADADILRGFCRSSSQSAPRSSYLRELKQERFSSDLRWKSGRNVRDANPPHLNTVQPGTVGSASVPVPKGTSRLVL